MTWLAWRVQRLQFLVVVAAVALFAAWLVLTGLPERSAWAALVSAGCMNGGPASGCGGLFAHFSSTDRFTLVNLGILYAIPGLLGVVFGAPLVARDVEQGTNRFSWTQGITRTRWVAVKLAVGGVVVAATMGATVALAGWWTSTARTGVHIYPKTFDVVGFVPVAYGLFAFLLGAGLGAVIRRTGWTIAALVPAFAGARLLVRHFGWHLAPLATSTVNPFGPEPAAVMNGWVLNQGFLPISRMSPAPGHSWSSFSDALYRCTSSLTLPPGSSPAAYQSVEARCAATRGLHYVVQYQPPGHFWLLQGVESAIFLSASVLLVALTVLTVRRWRT